MWERSLSYLYESFGAPYPRASLVLGTVVFGLVGVLVFGLVWGFAAKSYREKHPEGTLMDRPDPQPQQQARVRLYEFFSVSAKEAYRDAIEFTNDVHTRLGEGQGFDPNQTVAGLLRKYAESDFAAKFTALDAVMPPNGKEASFVELSRRFEQFLCSYEKLVFWVQHAALLVPITPATDVRYQRWNTTDIEFLSKLKDTLATREIDWLRQQASGCRESFRLREALK